MTYTSENNPLHVDWIEQSGRSPFIGRLGLTIAPGKRGTIYGRTHDRNLATDLKAVKDAGADIIVNLMETDEMAEWQMQGYFGAARAAGLEAQHFPIPDMDIPADRLAFQRFVRGLYAQLQAGKVVVVHCLGGLGRSGTLAACLLTENRMGAREAVQLVRRCRAGAIQAQAQEDLVQNYDFLTWR